MDMSRNALLLIVALVVLLVGSNWFHTARGTDLKADGDSLRLENAALKPRLERFQADSATVHTRLDALANHNRRLEADRERASQRTDTVTVLRDAARADIDIDTLTAPVRGLLRLEQQVSAALRNELAITRTVLDSTRAENALIKPRLDEAEALVVSLKDQRDGAMTLVARHEARLEFNLWKFLGDEIPQLGACAGGGAIVASLYEGQALVGAGIGLGICLVKSAVFK